MSPNTRQDRTSPDAWNEQGKPAVREKARSRVNQILSAHQTLPFAAGADKRIRASLPTRLRKESVFKPAPANATRP